MGVVYEARQLALNRVVALKTILLGDAAPPEAIRRFLDEAELTARLKHSHVVPVYELGQSEGGPYLVMELIRGRSLAEVLASEVMHPREAAELVRKLAGAVEHAHQQGVIHRDLKPGNVLMEGGEPRVTDFGLARRLEGGSDVTATGAIVGTASYLSPEQASPGKEVGPATDIWALGAVLYECLTGRPLFRGANTLDTLLLVRHADPVPPRRLQPSLPRDLEVIVLKSLEKQPHRRYGTALALADDLGRFLASQPILARRAGPLERAWKWVRRRPATTVVMALSAVVLVAVTALVVSRQYAGRLERTNRDLDASLARLQVEQAATEQALKRESVVLYANRILRAQAAAEDGDLVTAEAILAECPAEQRGWEWDFVEGLTQVAGRRIVSEAGAIRAAAFVDNGSRLATLARKGDKGMLETWETETGKQFGGAEFDWPGSGAVALAATNKHFLNPTSNPKIVVVLAGDSSVWEFERPSNKVRARRPVAGLAEVVSVAVSANGARAAFLDRTGTIRVVDCADGTQISEWKQDKKDSPTAVALSGNGTQLAIGYSRRVALHDLTGKAKPTSIVGDWGGGRTLMHFCEPQTLFHCSPRSQPRLLDLKTGLTGALLPGHQDGTTAVAYRPSSPTLLATAGQNSEFQLVRLAGGASYRTFRGLNGPPEALAFAQRDSGTLKLEAVQALAVVEATGSVRLWDCSQVRETGAVVEALGGGLGDLTLARVNSGRVLLVGRYPPKKLEKGRMVSVRSAFFVKPLTNRLPDWIHPKDKPFGEGVGCISPDGLVAWPAIEPGAWVLGTVNNRSDATFCPTPTRPLAMTIVKDRLFLACEGGDLWGGPPDASWVQRRTRSALPFERPTGLADTPSGLLLVTSGDTVAMVEPERREVVAALRGEAPPPLRCPWSTTPAPCSPGPRPSASRCGTSLLSAASRRSRGSRRSRPGLASNSCRRPSPSRPTAGSPSPGPTAACASTRRKLVCCCWRSRRRAGSRSWRSASATIATGCTRWTT